MTAFINTKTYQQKPVHNKGNLQIPVVGCPQIAAVASMGASTQGPDVP